MLKIENINVGYKNRKVLKDVSFMAESGEITVVLGKNGSGKTTLVRTISSSCHYTGRIFVDGQDLKTMKLRERARKISVMPQTLPLPHVTVRELVAFGRTPYLGYGGRLGEKDKELVQKAMEETGTISLAEELVCSLSGGERQRAYFAMLTAQGADTILLDEPTANLDTEYRQMVYSYAQNMRSSGKTIIIVMHHITEAVRLADKICVLDKGRICFEGCPKDFSTSSLPEDLFGVHPLEVTDFSGIQHTVFLP